MQEYTLRYQGLASRVNRVHGTKGLIVLLDVVCFTIAGSGAGFRLGFQGLGFEIKAQVLAVEVGKLQNPTEIQWVAVEHLNKLRGGKGLRSFCGPFSFNLALNFHQYTIRCTSLRSTPGRGRG